TRTLPEPARIRRCRRRQALPRAPAKPVRRRVPRYLRPRRSHPTQHGGRRDQRIWPWPEPRGHSLWKLGLAHLYRGNHGSAERAFREAESLRELDNWGRWTWETSLWRSRGELSLAEEKYEEAWTWASRALEAAIQCRQRKHAARALRLQGQILAAQGRLEDAARALTASLDQACMLGTARESWIGQAALGNVF